MSGAKKMAQQDRRLDILVACLLVAFISAAACMLLGLELLFCYAVSVILFLSAMLGAERRGTTGPFKYFFLATLLCWLVAFSIMAGFDIEAIRERGYVDELIGSLPPETAAAVYLLWPAPFLLMTLPYALLFRRNILSDADVEAINKLAAENRQSADEKSV